MSYFNKASTDIFIPDGNGFRQAPPEMSGLSFNDCMTFLGYHRDQVMILYSSQSDKITNIAFEIFTRNIVFIRTNKKITFIADRDLKKALTGFSVAKYYTSGEIKNILESGIENESLSVDYLASVLKLTNVSRNGMFYASRIKTYLYFTNGLLSNFLYDDGFSTRAKELKQVNKTVYDILAQAAYKYRSGDDFGAQKEINIQSEAWAAIPNAFGNEFIPLHTYNDGLVNLHMIRVCHYGHPITRLAFQEINYGRYQVISNNGSGDVVLRLGHFDYRFSINGDLIEFKFI